MSRINTEHLRNCVERDVWYNNALGRLTQRGTVQEDPDEEAEAEVAAVAGVAEVASAPDETPPPPRPTKSIRVMTKPHDIPQQ